MDAPLMRIRTDRIGEVHKWGWDTLWNEFRQDLREFDVEKAISSSFILLTNTDDVVIMMVEPTHIKRMSRWPDLTYMIEGAPLNGWLIGELDPLAYVEERVAYTR